MMLQRQFGPYLLGEEIARGGMGAVYKALHSQLKTPVAIKILLQTDGNNSLKRFKQEAQVLARLDHPNVVKVVDLGVQEGYPYLAMELVKGRDLKRLLDAGLNRDEALQHLLTVAQTLDYCHQRGVSHRDLKPGNIVVEEGTQRPVLIDFGLAKRDKTKMQLESLDRSRLSLSGEIKGTPGYMAPEQLDPSFGEEGHQSDVYALGGILYFILTGRTPFQGATNYNLMVKVMNTEPEDPRSHEPEIPAPLAELALSALSKDPNARPFTAEVFAELLQTGLASPAEGRARPRRFLLLPVLLLVTLLAIVGVASVVFEGAAEPEEARSGQQEEAMEAAPLGQAASGTPHPQQPSPVTAPATPPRPASRDLTTLIAEFDRAYSHDNIPDMLRVSNELVRDYPKFYRSYLYRATAHAAILEEATDRADRIQAREQIRADFDRAIELTDNPQEKVRLELIMQRFLGAGR